MRQPADLTRIYAFTTREPTEKKKTPAESRVLPTPALTRRLCKSAARLVALKKYCVCDVWSSPGPIEDFPNVKWRFELTVWGNRDPLERS